jgi:predicted permease
MQNVLLQAAILIICGALWRKLRPGDLDPDNVRRAVGDLVYYLLLPALVLSVLWRAPLGLDSLRIAGVAASGVLMGLAVAGLWCRLCSAPRYQAGALILAAGFPNATYLGLPILEATLGPTGRSIAIQYDLFACTPLLLTVGVLLAQQYGQQSAQQGGIARILPALLKVPPLWAALLAIIFNLSGTPFPDWLAPTLQSLGAAVIPLMLFALGLGLSWDPQAARQLPIATPALVIQLLLMPLLAWGLADLTGLEGDKLTGVVLEAAMPSMVIGLVLCDRFGLDTRLYAVTVTLGTALSLVTLPFWSYLLMR